SNGQSGVRRKGITARRASHRVAAIEVHRSGKSASRNAKARPFEMARAPARGTLEPVLSSVQRVVFSEVSSLLLVPFGAESRALNARDEGLLSCFDNELCCFFRMGDQEEVRRSLDLHDLLCASALCHELSRRDRKVLVSSAVDEPGWD